MLKLRFLPVACLLLLTSACSSDDSNGKSSPVLDGGTQSDSGAGGNGGSGGGGNGGSGGGNGDAGPDGGTSPFTVGGSVGQVWVTDADEGDVLVLRNSAGEEIARGTADSLGSLILRNVTPGDGYTVSVLDGTEEISSAPFRVLSRTDVPDPALYTSQTLVQGLNYVKMRDGIELAVTVRLPAGMTIADGPFPTVIEYSGYQVAAPGDLFAAAVAAVGAGGGLDGLTDPLLPATSTAVGSIVAPLLGYAAVSVQMRGSGCSGGDFQLFDVPSTFDGYDAVEIVAAQSWVKGGKVGLVGISFSGISQIFTGGSRPPHLAAISPMSVTDDIYTGTGFPGGIFNNGFAQSWLNERVDNARPAPGPGAQPYATKLIEDGDTRCLANQKLRLQTQDVNALIEENPFREPSLIDDRSPVTWADEIDVPVFLVGQFQDEQTGGHFPEMLPALRDNPNVWITLQNGAHVDALGPATITRWAEFLDLFVAEKIPSIPAAVTALSGELYKAIAGGAPSAPLPATRFDSFTDVAAATAEYKKDDRVRLIFDSGGGPAGPGAFEAGWELGFTTWPPTEGVATTFYLGANGALEPSAGAAAEVSYTGDPSKRPSTSLGPTGGLSGPWAALPAYNWTPVEDGFGLGFVTAALTEDMVIAGPSSLDLQLKSSALDTDLQVTLSDVRPDGQEMYVQSGWLRASHRKIDAAASTATNPVQTHLESDAANLPAGTFETVRIQIYPVAYGFRAGNRLRITITAPGGDRPRWEFQTIEDGSITNTIELGSSKLVLPVVAGATVGGPLPACPSNRGQPCRTYAAASNGG